MGKTKFLIWGLFLIMLQSCYTPESLRSFDSETWKADRYACDGKREKLIPEFEKIRKELYGKKEYIIRNLLGKPDKENLLERSQRIYYYYLEPGTQCQDPQTLSDVTRAEVRINSLGKVSEITYNHPDKINKPE
jgi:hypothetical protein